MKFKVFRQRKEFISVGYEKIFDVKNIKRECGDIFSKLIESGNGSIEDYLSSLCCDLDQFNAARHVIDDANDAIESFVSSDGFDDNNRGDSLLKLYGLLSAVYMQQEVIGKIAKNFSKKIEKLEIREVRNFISSHPKRVNNSNRLHSDMFIVLNPIDCIGFNISYSTRGDYKLYKINLEAQLNEHMGLVYDFFDGLKKEFEKQLNK